jgi:hypothetical protein
MCLKFKEKVTNSSTPINLIDDNFRVVFELVLLVSNIKREVYGVLECFQVFSERHMGGKKKSQQCFFMLDFRFKNL